MALKIFTFVSIIAIDQYIKLLAVKNLLPSVGGFLNETVCNYGIAWGIAIPKGLFLVVWLAVIVFFVLFTLKNKWSIFLLAVIAGAISNFIDRVFGGCVIDFIKIGSFPLFNVADICITGGLALFLIQEFKKKTKKIEQRKERDCIEPEKIV